MTTGVLGADVAGGRWFAEAALSVSEGEDAFILTGENGFDPKLQITKGRSDRTLEKRHKRA